MNLIYATFIVSVLAGATGVVFGTKGGRYPINLLRQATDDELDGRFTEGRQTQIPSRNFSESSDYRAAEVSQLDERNVA